MSRKKRRLQNRMPPPEAVSQTESTPPSRLRWLRLAVACAAAIVILAIGPRLAGWWTRQRAIRQLDIGALSEAHDWLSWSVMFEPRRAEVDLLSAACFRRQERYEAWSGAMRAAEVKGADKRQLGHEAALGMIQAGDFDLRTENQLGLLIEAGVSPHDVGMAFVRGYLTRDEPVKARATLEAWERDAPEAAAMFHAWALYWQWAGEPVKAERQLRNSLTTEPRYELAYGTLAELLESQERLESARDRYIEFATQFPGNSDAKLGLARVLRQLGDREHARRLLDALIHAPTPTADVAAEMAQLEFESGNLEQADRWFARADLEGSAQQETLVAAAIFSAVGGDPRDAERWIAKIDARMSDSVRTHDLRYRVVLEPTNRQAAEELASLSERSATLPVTSSTGSDEAVPTGRNLYALHCAACHGDNGDGRGRAARHLTPRPRDLRGGRFRLVSTRNGVPTQEDLVRVIRQGMPGTSMRAFDQLNESELAMLAEQVRVFWQEGLQEQFRAVLKEEGEPMDEAEVREFSVRKSTPGAAVDIPEIGPPTPDAIKRGREVYLQQNCQSCHGDDGVGAWDLILADDDGQPARPRDLAHEPFRGGAQPDALYHRILLGMPGSPHPSSANVGDAQLVDLIHYCCSLRVEPKRILTSYEQWQQATCRDYLRALGRSVPERSTAENP